MFDKAIDSAIYTPPDHAATAPGENTNQRVCNSLLIFPKNQPLRESIRQHLTEIDNYQKRAVTSDPTAQAFIFVK
jgi:hypothetical protein